jgi:hypothetical protein
MAMQPALHTVEGLAVELDRDRRTIAKLLRNVPPDGQVKGRSAWRLVTAIEALRRREIAISGNAPALDELERLIDLLESGLERAQAEPDQVARRKILIGIGPLVGQINNAMESAAGDCRSGEKPLLDSMREQVMGGAVGTFLELGGWELDMAAPSNPQPRK